MLIFHPLKTVINVYIDVVELSLSGDLHCVLSLHSAPGRFTVPFFQFIKLLKCIRYCQTELYSTKSTY